MTLVIPRHHEVANAEHSAGGYWIPGSRPFRTSPNDVTCDSNFEIDQPAFISGVNSFDRATTERGHSPAQLQRTGH